MPPKRLTANTKQISTAYVKAFKKKKKIGEAKKNVLRAIHQEFFGVTATERAQMFSSQVA